MSDNTANIQLNVEATDINQMLGTLSELQRKLGGVQDDFDDIGDEAKKAGKKIKDAGDDADGAGGKMDGLAGKLGAMAAGFIAAAVTIEVAKKGFEFLKASVEAAGEANELVAATIDVTSTAFTNMQVAIGEVLTTGEAGNDIMGTFTEVLDLLGRVVDDNKEALANFVRGGLQFALRATSFLFDAMVPLINLFTGLELVAITVKLALIQSANGLMLFTTVIADGTLLLVGKLIDGFGSLAGAAAGLAEFLGVDFAADALSGIQEMSTGFTEGIDGMRGGIATLQGELTDEIADATDNFSDAVDRAAARNDRWTGSAMDMATATNDIVRGMNSGTTAARQQAAALGVLESAVEDTATAIGTSSDGEGDSLMGNLSGYLTMLQRISQSTQEFLGGLANAASDLAEQEAEQRLERLQERTELARDLIADAASGIGEALGDVFSGEEKDISKSLGKLLGSMLVSVGNAAIAMGTIALIPTLANPVGTPAQGAGLIVGGIAAVAAGSALGAIGGKKGGKKSPEKSAPSSSGGSSTQNVVINQATTFGFVGDRRAATREIEELNTRTIERNL